MVHKGLFDDLQAIFGAKKPNEDTANATTTTTEAPKENKCEEVCKNQFAGNIRDIQRQDFLSKKLSLFY